MLEIQNLTKTFVAKHGTIGKSTKSESSANSAVRAIDDVSLHIREGEMFTLLGPSGCGKTTTLRSVAGLETPDTGRITLDGRTLFDRGSGKTTNIAANHRGLGMVFQSYAIWPHLTVFENAAFPLRVLPRSKRPDRKTIETTVMRVLTAMELDPYAGRNATKLSGGQQQRLALARALAIQPPLLLLDEPLSNLDAILRESLRSELKRLQRELGITSVYVTHDQTEALALSSRIAVMSKGRVEQVGTPREIYATPANRFVAEFIGTANFVTGNVQSVTESTLTLSTSFGVIEADVNNTNLFRPGDEATIAIRPESIDLIEGEPLTRSANSVAGKVVQRSYLGDAIDHIIDVGGHELKTRVPSRTSIPSGTTVTAVIDRAQISCFC